MAAGLTSLENALRHDFNVVHGTDLCWSPKCHQGGGLLIHQKVCCLAEAPRHATVNNAAVVRMKGQVGEITKGSHADLVIVDANPFDGLECFSQIDNKVVGEQSCLIRFDRC